MNNAGARLQVNDVLFVQFCFVTDADKLPQKRMRGSKQTDVVFTLSDARSFFGLTSNSTMGFNAKF